MSTIVIGSREFTVEQREGTDAHKGAPLGPLYTLTGKRGAKYGTMRNVNRPETMFLIDLRGFGMAVGYESVRLTDRNGVLEVVS